MASTIMLKFTVLDAQDVHWRDILQMYLPEEVDTMQLKQVVILLAAFTVLVLIMALASFGTDSVRIATHFLGPIAGCITHGC